MDSQLQFSSNAYLFRHEREAHGFHGHGDPHLCLFEGCDRSVPGYGFPRRWNLFDHMKRVHEYPVCEQPNSPETSPTGQGQRLQNAERNLFDGRRLVYCRGKPIQQDCRSRLLEELSDISPHVPQSQLGDFVPVEVENKQNPTMDGEVMQTEPPTDSEYASATRSKSERIQSTGDVRSPCFITSGYEPVRNNISELANSLLHEIRSEQLDDTILQQISRILPELFKTFALKVGHNASAQMCRDVMFFIHKYRR
jgi:hypothetical protein